MRGLVAKNSKLLFAGVIALAVTSTLLFTPHTSAQTMVGATVCGGSASTITITNPVSDSVVTDPTITIEGSVAQSSQIEIRIDDTFDSIIPLTVGQTTYSSSMHLPMGTHTITVKAISLCPGTSGTASVVVTLEEPPQVPSTGNTTDTSVGNMTVNSDGEPMQEIKTENGFGLFNSLLQPLEPLAQWLNITPRDVADQSGQSSMTIGRAVAFTVGLYLSIIGFAPALLQALASFPPVISLLPAMNLPRRIRYLARFGRLAGVVLIVGSLFLP